MEGRPKLVVGLGNPGTEYQGTRHNIGFAVVETLASRGQGSFKRKWRFDAEVAEIVVAGGKLTVAKPRTYMNRSGLAALALVNWLKIAPPELLVVVDDADLELGELRLRPAGGSGGHNGLRSIIGALGGVETFPRLRIGIGRRGGPGTGELADHVLGKFSAAEREAAAGAVERATAAVEWVLTRGLSAAMNEFNRRQRTTERESEEL